MEYLVLSQLNFVFLTSQVFLQFLQIQLPTACWRNFFYISKIRNFYHIDNQSAGKISTFYDKP